jgi:octaprenyl-diphosphate synthase
MPRLTSRHPADNVAAVNHEAKTTAKKPEAPLPIKRAFDLINRHLYTVEERIKAQSKAFDPAVEGYVAYACESSGKRLRPALALLSGGVTGHIGPHHIDLAVVVELIHAATLIHDDIMDGADLRRGRPSANARWGNAISVLLGDCLFAHALKLSTGFPDAEISRRIAHAASEVCTGEIIQTQRRFDLKLGIPEYYRIIEMKTAALFAVASELGAFLNEAEPETIAGMRKFGFALGTAYQIYDDCLDLSGSEEKAGKTLGTDLRKGKLTLPVLLLLQGATPTEHQHFSEILLRGEQDQFGGLRECVRERGCLKNAADAAVGLVADAERQLAPLAANRYRDGLLAVCDSLRTLIARTID